MQTAFQTVPTVILGVESREMDVHIFAATLVSVNANSAAVNVCRYRHCADFMPSYCRLDRKCATCEPCHCPVGCLEIPTWIHALKQYADVRTDSDSNHLNSMHELSFLLTSENSPPFIWVLWKNCSSSDIFCIAWCSAYRADGTFGGWTKSLYLNFLAMDSATKVDSTLAQFGSFSFSATTNQPQ